MHIVKLSVNGETRELPDLDPETPLLWVLRDHLGKTGTRFGCGKGLCGACTIHVDGAPARACITPASVADGKKITTIEGLEGRVADALRAAWSAGNVPQCGFCQGGQLMSAEHQLRTSPAASKQARDGAMEGNICRCGTYTRIRSAMDQASAGLGGEK
ncbi:MAG: (2Fe-2S)-binding protein [Planctomycetota bacterium]|nr:(2Fe-2S)-binding protein [Planctomycetota bacterium]MDA1113265.1 (2Fe-2S)-binding protein [Planctomycetota bacterium]